MGALCWGAPLETPFESLPYTQEALSVTQEKLP